MLPPGLAAPWGTLATFELAVAVPVRVARFLSADGVIRAPLLFWGGYAGNDTANIVTFGIYRGQGIVPAERIALLTVPADSSIPIPVPFPLWCPSGLYVQTLGGEEITLYYHEREDLVRAQSFLDRR